MRVSGSLVTEGKEDKAEIHEQEWLGQAHDECPTDVHISGMEAVNAEAIERCNLLVRVVKPDISDGDRGGWLAEIALFQTLTPKHRVLFC